MAEQSSSASTMSPGTMWRTLVMLLCMVALPLAALRGTAWSDLGKTVPDITKKILDGRWGENSVLAREPRPQAPLFRPASRMDTRAEPPSPPPSSPRYANVESWARHQPASSAEADRPVPATVPGPHFAETTSTEHTATPNGLRPVAFRTRDDDTADPRRTPLVPVARRDRAWGIASGPDSPPLQNAVIRPGASLRQKEDSDGRLSYVLDRLRELGAVYYLLETWGNDGQRFRFHCKMAIGGNPNYTRHFEAIDRDALQAMGKVLGEVETWRANH